MRIKIKRNYADTIFYCKNCEKNDLLFEETVKEINKILFFTLSEEIITNRIYCERCKCDIDRSNLQINKTASSIKNDGVKKTTAKETYFTDKQVLTITKTTIDYSEYIPNIKNKTLYFDMLYMLIDYIETYQRNVNADDNKFYQLSLEHKSITDDEFCEDFEDNIILKFKECISEYTQSELNSLLTNSLNVLKGEMLIERKIQELYFNIFRLMEIGNLQHHTFFESLL